MTSQAPVLARDVTANEVLTTAYHEAGHATAALVLAPQLLRRAFVNQRVVLDPRVDNDTRCWLGGVLFTDWPQSDEFVEKMAICTAAGGVGEVMSVPGALIIGQRDCNILRTHGARHSFIAALQERPVAHELALQQLQVMAGWRAYEILQAEFKLYRSIAATLYQHFELTGEQLLYLLSQHGTGQTYHSSLLQPSG